MMEMPQGILPAVRKMKDFELALQTEHPWIVFLETRLAQVKSLVQYAHREGKKVLIHADLVHGLKADEYGMEFLLREVKPDGIVSTRSAVISLAKKNKLLAIQRMFLLDSLALEHNLKLRSQNQPDCIEVLPGILPQMIRQISDETSIPIIAGGLINTPEEAQEALAAGAIAVSASNRELWHFS